MLIAGNWKMNTTRGDAIALAEAVGEVVRRHQSESVRVAVCPPFINLEAVVSALRQSSVLVGGQNLHQADSGAFTGEVSGDMLRTIGCHLVILGHSERRQYFNEHDTLVNEKCRAARRAGLQPIVCVGETIDERNLGVEEEVVGRQIAGAFDAVAADDEWLPVVAYEPVWAIGTGQTATPDQAQSMHAFIRSCLVDSFGERLAADTEILYGGSMNPTNALELLSQTDIDGGLIGGASLKADDFGAIVETAMSVSNRS